MLEHLWNGWRAEYVQRDSKKMNGSKSIFTQILESEMSDHESFPLPRGRSETQHVADGDAVGARVRHQRNAMTVSESRRRLPHGEIDIRPHHTPFLEKEAAPDVDAVDEVRDLFSSVDSRPTLVGGLLTFGTPRSFGPLCGSSVPDGVADLFQPGFDHHLAPEHPENRLGGLAGTRQRRHQDLVEMFAPKSLGQHFGLAVPTFGQRRVVDIHSVAHPLRFGVTNENDLHDAQLYDRGLSTSCVARPGSATGRSPQPEGTTKSISQRSKASWN